MKYKVLILGWKIDNWLQSKASVNALSYNLYLAFQKLDNVEVYYCNKSEKELPEADFVIIIIYKGDNIDYYYIREKTGCKKIVSFRETRFAELDFSFIFNSHFNNIDTEYIPFPYNAELLKPTVKEKNTILIDHYWEDYLGTKNDLTFRIEEWLTEIKDDYKIYRMIRFTGEEETIKSFEIPIFYSDYLNYLKVTERIENYIITHKECYPHSVTDMVARGTRILTPTDFIPGCMQNALQVPIFNNKDEFLSIIKSSVGEEWSEKYKHCTDYNDVVKIIDNKFKSWL